ncbi:MAG: UDP-N-acetylglucosamine 2-epimerase [SAR324 cluster bacterium]|nr:UDP-N-acetylglucosamine 2-epimerase [SAR324 cluster bacterium]
MVAGLAGYYQRIKIGHIEAGLRTGNKYAPWPEEMNRKLIGAMADLHFAPTIQAQNNLINEGILKDQILVTGNTAIDALHWILNHEQLSAAATQKDPRIVLITAHRRESFGEGFRNICKAIQSLALMFPNVDFIYPVHPNPNVQQAVKEILDTNLLNIKLIEPLDYLHFVKLMSSSVVFWIAH